MGLSFRVVTFRIVVGCMAILLTGQGLRADDLLTQDQVDAIVGAADELAAKAEAMTQPLPEGQVKILQAVVIQTAGRAQWRPDEESPWKQAKVDDLLKAGAKIRTGGDSSMTLRVGLNSTLLVGSRTRVALPEMVQAGGVLTTTMGLERGRLDFKVDRIGLTNDFRVVTPSMTLAVRGTGGAIRQGALVGTEIMGAQYNLMRAIELKYFVSQLIHYLSGPGRSSSKFENPVLAELYYTIGPPALFTRALDLGSLSDRLETGLDGFRDIQVLKRIENGLEGVDNTMYRITGITPVDPFTESLVMALCAPSQTEGSNISIFFSNYYEPQLISDFDFVDQTASLLTQAAFDQICAEYDRGTYTSDLAFALMIIEISNFCTTYDIVNSPAHELCVTDFLMTLQNFAFPIGNP